MRSLRPFVFLLLPLLASAVACGAFDSANTDEPTDAGASGPDASPDHTGPEDATTPTDAGADAPDAEASAAPVHLVFVTTAKVDGSFASAAASPWAAADAICASEAAANSLSGTFVAWLSYVDGIGTSFNAGTRIPDVAYYMPGIVADGGGPLLVAATKAELLSTGPRVAIDRVGTGARVDQDENPNVAWVWTGTGATGESASQTCAAWTTASNAQSGIAGNARRIPLFTASDWTELGGRTCDVKRRLYCFQK